MQITTVPPSTPVATTQRLSAQAQAAGRNETARANGDEFVNRVPSFWVMLVPIFMALILATVIAVVRIQRALSGEHPKKLPPRLPPPEKKHRVKSALGGREPVMSSQLDLDLAAGVGERQ